MIEAGLVAVVKVPVGSVSKFENNRMWEDLHSVDARARVVSPVIHRHGELDERRCAGVKDKFRHHSEGHAFTHAAQAGSLPSIISVRRGSGV